MQLNLDQTMMQLSWIKGFTWEEVKTETAELHMLPWKTYSGDSTAIKIPLSTVCQLHGSFEEDLATCMYI